MKRYPEVERHLGTANDRRNLAIAQEADMSISSVSDGNSGICPFLLRAEQSELVGEVR